MKCMIIACLTVFFFILSPFQAVSYIKCMIIMCLTVFSFYLVTISGGELREVHDYCLFDSFLFFIMSPFQVVSYIKCLIIVCFTFFPSI